MPECGAIVGAMVQFLAHPQRETGLARRLSLLQGEHGDLNFSEIEGEDIYGVPA